MLYSIDNMYKIAKDLSEHRIQNSKKQRQSDDDSQEQLILKSDTADSAALKRHVDYIKFMLEEAQKTVHDLDQVKRFLTKNEKTRSQQLLKLQSQPKSAAVAAPAD